MVGRQWLLKRTSHRRICLFFPIHHASWNSYLTTAQEWHARHPDDLESPHLKASPTPLSLCPHTEESANCITPVKLSFEEHKPVNQAQPTVSFSPGGPLSKDSRGRRKLSRWPETKVLGTCFSTSMRRHTGKRDARGGCKPSRITSGHISSWCWKFQMWNFCNSRE